MKEKIKKIKNKIKLEKLKSKIKKYRKLIALVSLILLVLVVMIRVIYVVATKEAVDPKISTSFFIQNDELKYALFSEKGKQLSDFKYTYVTSFYNGIARVEDEGNNSAVVNEKGKYVIDFNEYDRITNYGSLIVATKGDKKYLINYKGKELIEDKDFKVYSSMGIDSFIIIQKDKYYYVYLYDGSIVTKFKTKDKIDAPEVNEEGNFASIYYDNVTHLINSLTGKMLATVKDKTHYCISGSSENGEVVTLNSCVSWYDSNDKTSYKVLRKNRVADIPKECERVYLDNNNLVCVSKGKGYLVKDDNKLVKEPVSNMSYENYKTYAYTDKDTVKFVKNNNKKNSYEGYKLADKGYSSSGIYLLYKDKEYTYVQSNGKILSTTTYKNATSYDENLLAKVSTNGEKYILINKRGKQVSEEFDTSMISNNHYIITRKDKKGLLSPKGKELLECLYSSLEVREYKDKYYAYTFNSKEYELHDLKKKKVVLSSKTALQFYDNYIKTTDKKTTTYYTYTGKVLYEKKA